ncbi:Hypothetical predicted protein, partial [Paramuricea clavata]
VLGNRSSRECQGENGDSEDEISIRKVRSSRCVHHKSNGRAENAVQAVKRLMKKAKKDNADVYLAVLDYRNTPTQGSESSPAQRLMSRRTKTLLPTTAKLLAPRVVENHHQEIVKGQERQAKYYNRGAKDLPRLKKEDKVRIQDHGQGLKKSPSVKATVKAEVGIRSYEVETQDGQVLRRNRSHLRKTTEDEDEVDETIQTEVHTDEDRESNQTEERQSKQAVDFQREQKVEIRTRSGRLVNRPAYLKDYVSFVF